MDATLSVVMRKENDSSLTNEAYARFSTVQLHEISHPFFNQVWQGCHTLDDKSPMLSLLARKRIASNGGYWPAEWNNPAAIRRQLKFSCMVRKISLILVIHGLHLQFT